MKACSECKRSCRDGRQLITANAHTCVRPIGPLLTDLPHELLIPVPRLVLSAAPKEGVAAERNLSQLYCLPYTFPPTMTSTVARSNGFHAASPIHARVSPR